MSGTDNEIDTAEQVQPVNNLEAQGDQEDAPVSPDATSATLEEVAAAPLPATAKEVPDLRQEVTIGTPMTKVDEGTRQYKDELVSSVPVERMLISNQAIDRVEPFTRFEKVALAQMVQIHDALNYNEFAIDDVVAINQRRSGGYVYSTIMMIGGGTLAVSTAPSEAEELLRTWRSRRATQRR